MLRLFMAAEGASADMTKRNACTVKGCVAPFTHHHLDELDGQPSLCTGDNDDYDRVKPCCELGPLFEPNPDGKCRWFDCTNDAIGVVGRDPYDHVSWSPIVTPRAYCLNCYNERVLYALDFIRSEK